FPHGRLVAVDDGAGRRRILVEARGGHLCLEGFDLFFARGDALLDGGDACGVLLDGAALSASFRLHLLPLFTRRLGGGGAGRLAGRGRARGRGGRLGPRPGGWAGGRTVPG